MKTKTKQGIILAGGTGSRLRPTTLLTNKHLLHVYDRPMIYFPLATLIAAGINDILIITNECDLIAFEKLLGNGKQWGVKIQYLLQSKPLGIAHGLSLARKFVTQENFTLILGDNIFLSEMFSTILRRTTENSKASIFATPVKDASRFGVVSLDDNGLPIFIEEKPKNPTSNLAITGCYYFTHKAFDYIREQKPSFRGELEVTDLLMYFCKSQSLDVKVLNSEITWFDAGTPRSLLRCSQFVAETELLSLGSPELAAHFSNFIDASTLDHLITKLGNCDYAVRLLDAKTSLGALKKAG